MAAAEDLLHRVPKRVTLTTAQEAVFARIKDCWSRINGQLSVPDSVHVNAICVENANLFKELKKAAVFPPFRYRFFDDARYNPGGYGKSRFERLVEGAGSVYDAMDSIDFIRYLIVLIEGPDLPLDVIQVFIRTMDGLGSSGQIMDQLKRYVKQEARKLDGYRSTLLLEDMFCLLAVELDYPHCDTIRKAVMNTKRT